MTHGGPVRQIGASINQDHILGFIVHFHSLWGWYTHCNITQNLNEDSNKTIINIYEKKLMQCRKRLYKKKINGHFYVFVAGKRRT